MQITKRQHYVWRYYLSQWTDNQTVEGNLFCCRNGKIFFTGLMNIGQENYFYKFIDISDTDAWWIEKLCIYENFPIVLKQIDKMWLESYRYPFKLIEYLKSIGINDEQTFQEIINQGEESIYCKTEEIGKVYLDKLYKEDCSFYLNFDDKSDFNLYICEQFFRTKKRLEALKDSNAFNLDYTKIWGPMRHIFSTNLAFNLTYRNDKKFMLKLIHNKTDIKFITGDQPVINKYSTKENLGKVLDKFEFYYPITPKLAILLTEKDYKNDELIITDDSKIYEFNDLIFVNSQEQVYATSKDELERYKDMPRD